ncbi:MAG TPA: aspartyl protease family protein [Haliangiales bacterium]|nr:aspartyl protease family protein [Haliangiales bacterium]
MRWLVALLGCAACGGGFDYEGTAGRPQPVAFPSLVPVAPVVVDAAAPKSFGIDTGAPGTLIDSGAFPSRPLGAGTAALGVLGLRFASVPAQTGGYFTADDPLGGLVGADLLAHFAFSLDYKGARAWLSDPFSPANAPADLGAGAEVDVPFGLVGAHRVTFQATIEGQPPTWVLLDTGATAVTLDEGFYAQLGGAARPRLDGLKVVTVNGIATGFWTRVWRVTAGGASPGASPGASVDDVQAIVVPGSMLFRNVAAETGRDVRVLLGGKFLRSFFTTIDYQAERVRLARYVDPTHIDPDEWIRPGFRLTLRGGAWTVTTVYVGTDASAKGMLEGDVVLQIDGMAIVGLGSDAVDALMRGRPVGGSVAVELRRGAQTIDVQVLVEDLLPHYPPPA